MQVQIHELRVQIHEFKFTSYEFNFSSYEFRSRSYEFKSTSYEFKYTSYEFKSTSHESNFQIYELRVQIHELGFQIHEFKNHLINENPSKQPKNFLISWDPQSNIFQQFVRQVVRSVSGDKLVLYFSIIINDYGFNRKQCE